jgi:MarR-like DNA-binding transcriptional regulator SgrR of sgrS sRNA
MRLEQLNLEHKMHQAVTFALTSTISNRFLFNRQGKFVQKYMQQRFIRAPCALALGGLTTYFFNKTVMETIYNSDLKQMGMEKYFEMDLDADMMRNDLSQMGITVQARFYDAKKVKEMADKDNTKN